MKHKDINLDGIIMFDAFVTHLDGIFWTGYAEQLASENPELYNFEYNQFFNYYA